MEEYWNLFLNWLSSIGQRYADYQDQKYMNNQKLYPRSPRAEDRYAESTYGIGYNASFPMGYPIEEIKQDHGDKGFFDTKKPARIYRYINEPGDTVYAEDSPQYDILYGAARRHSTRKASTKRPRGDEYEVLRRRWNIARKLAKE